MFKGTLDGDVFGLYVKYVLAPTLNVGDVVFLDNLLSHKVDGVFDPIFEWGAYVWFLPGYSPDLNPTVACVVKSEVSFEKVEGSNF